MGVRLSVGILAVAAEVLVLVGGCGGEVDDVPAGSADAGAGGGHETAGGTGEGGTGDGTAGGSAGRGGAPVGGKADERGGAGGEPGGVGGEGGGNLSQQLERAAIKALGDIGAISDEIPIVGAGIVLQDDLCVGLDEQEGSIGRSGLASVVVKRSAAGKLVAVTVVKGGTAPIVEEQPMRKSGAGFVLDDLTLCASVDYGAENEYTTHLIKTKQAHFVFGDGEEGIELGVAVLHDDDTVHAARGVPDRHPPTVELVDVSELAAIDDVFNAGFGRRFAFSEPVKLTSTVSVVDAGGRDVAIQKVMSQGHWVGFAVQAVLSTEAELSLALEDRSGNRAPHVTKPFPGIDLARVDPRFEAAPSDDDFYTSDLWNDGVGPLLCEAAGVYPSADRDLDPEEAPALPPLSGEHSFYTGPCEVFFRVTRPDGATKLAFDARLIADTSWPLPPGVTLRGWSLDGAGAPFTASDAPEWSKDEAASTTDFFVSEPQTLSFTLPETGADLLISIQGGDKLWLDSLRVD